MKSLFTTLIGAVALLATVSLTAQGGFGITGGDELGSIDLCTGTFTSIAPLSPPPGGFPNGGEIINGELIFTTGNGEVISADLTTGATTTLFIVPGVAFTGLDVDPTTGLLYAITAVCGTSTTLHQIDLATQTVTTIGTSTVAQCGIWLIFDPTGQAYIGDIVSDSVHPIDKATGVVGAGVQIVDTNGAAINLNFGQDMDMQCDPVTGQLYGYLFDGDAFEGKFGTLNPLTGVFDELANYGLNDQLGVFVTDPDFQPGITCLPATVTLDAAGNGTLNANSVFDAVASTICNATSLSVSPNTFTCADLGAQSVTLTVVDDLGITYTCVATVNVQTDGSSTITPLNPTIPLGADGTVTITVDDLVEVAAGPCPATTTNIDILGGTTFDCSDIGPRSAILRINNPGGTQSFVSVDFTIGDDSLPTIFCNEKQWEETGGPLDTECGAYVILVEPTILSDNCIVDLDSYTVTNDGPADQVFPVGVTLLTWTVTDLNGNAVSCTQEIEVIDLAPAEIYCGGTVIGYANQGQCSANVLIDVPITNVCEGTVISGLGTFTFPITGGQQVITVTKPSGTVSVCTLDVAVIRQVGDNSNDNCLGPPDGSATDGLFMRSVGIESVINKTGDNGGYATFFDKPVEIEGDLSTVALALEGMGLDGIQSYYYYVWADFNCDGVFNNGNEFWYQATSAGPINATLDVPAHACEQVRVRVRVTKEPFDFAYGEAPSGEVEDYLLMVPQVDNQAGTATTIDGLPGKTQAPADPLTLQPNPATDDVLVTLGNEERAAVDMIITNMLGQEMLRRTYDVFPVEGVQLDLSSYDTGIYFVTTRRGDQQSTERLVVRR